MAKRKAGRATGRKKKAAKPAGASRSRSAERKAPGRRSGQASARKGTARKSAKRSSARPAATKARATARKTTRKATRPAARKAAPRKTTAQRSTPKKVASRRSTPRPMAARKVPALDRARRTVTDESLLPPSPPSTLDLDRTASAVRSGRREMLQKLSEHTETSPALTAGDVDADWESAYAVGDEAPGGDNPTPDQDIVDDIGKAVGVQYADNEELKGEKKISDRDRKRWELDPASAEDYGDHET